MRLCVRLDNPNGATVPINYQEYLTAAVYGLLEMSDADYARWLHDEGYPAEDGGPKRFKLFCFSGLRTPRRRAEGDWLRLGPGPIEWLVASPIDDFLTHGATGLLSAGTLRIGPATFPITEVQTLPAPALSETTRFTCLSPIVCAVPSDDGRPPRYLRPAADGPAFSEAVRRNLLRKHHTLYGRPPADERLTITFDPAYLARDPRGGTKLITYKGIKHVGALAPFTAVGSVALMQVMLDCGAGEKNAAGFGMVDVTPTPATHQTRATG